MVITVILRLLAGPLDSGDLVGQIEHVSSGAIEPVRGAADIVEFVRQAASGASTVTLSTDVSEAVEPAAS